MAIAVGPKTVTVRVEQWHIDKAREMVRGGTARRSQTYPIAVALWIDEDGLLFDGSVGTQYVALKGKRYALPWIAQEFIRAFDHGESAEPITFELKPL